MSSSSKKREFLGELTSSITHEMNEEISGVFNYLDQIDDDLREAEEDIDYLDLESLRNKVKIVKKEIEDFSERIKGVNSFFDNKENFEVTDKNIDSFIDKIKYYNTKFLMKKGIKLNLNSEITEEYSLKLSESMLVFLVSKLIKSISSDVSKIMNIKIGTTTKELTIEASLDHNVDNVLNLDLMKEVKELTSIVNIENLNNSIKLSICKKNEK